VRWRAPKRRSAASVHVHRQFPHPPYTLLWEQKLDLGRDPLFFSGETDSLLVEDGVAFGLA
jgi:hypothetical protein